MVVSGGKGGWSSSPGQWKVLKEVAREFRKNPTEAEKHLWGRLRRRQVLGFRFRRQQVIGRYIVDFYCPEAKLAVEIDGGVHLRRKMYDESRENELRSRGIVVLRFRNEEVMSDVNRVVERIAGALRELSRREA